jgi:hypothetical protein
VARRRGPPWRLIGGVFAVVTVAAMGLAFWTGGAKPAPEDPGVCWRYVGQGTSARFDRVAPNVLNLESCAAYLERMHLQEGGDVVGAYQGRFIFIDDQAIKSASRLDGSRWRVFFDPQRAALDRRLRSGTAMPTIVTQPAS